MACTALCLRGIFISWISKVLTAKLLFKFSMSNLQARSHTVSSRRASPDGPQYAVEVAKIGYKVLVHSDGQENHVNRVKEPIVW